MTSNKLIVRIFWSWHFINKFPFEYYLLECILLRCISVCNVQANLKCLGMSTWTLDSSVCVITLAATIEFIHTRSKKRQSWNTITFWQFFVQTYATHFFLSPSLFLASVLKTISCSFYSHHIGARTIIVWSEKKNK